MTSNFSQWLASSASSSLVGVVLLAWLSAAGNSQEAESKHPPRRVVECQGWRLHISTALLENEPERLEEALKLLEEQLQEIVRVVPEAAVTELRKVPFWISPEYPGTPPGAEYHPDALWLKNHSRDPAMEKGIELTNVRIFAEETRRMPNFALHELAHAYHDRVMPEGFANRSVRNAYERAKASGKYDSVEQRFGDGRSANAKAYAMTTPQEYFAECSEAFFSTNDFFPFTLEQLRKHDPEVTELLAEWWGKETRQTNASVDLIKDWKHAASLWINTTPDGAAIDPGAEIHDFPVCIRLFSDTFPFSECQRDGADLRFYSPSADCVLPHEIDLWDPQSGVAILWVRVPTIRGDERQELQVYWGNNNATSASSGKHVFDASNGFVTVWHFGDQLVDSAGSLQAKDTGTTQAEGPIGRARRFSSGRGLNLGTTIEDLPTGSSAHSTEAWIEVERPNSTILGWGNEKAQGKVVMQYRSPSRIHMDCYFSGANIATDRIVPLRTWKHIVHTYSPQATRIYLDGVLVEEHRNRTPVLALEKPSKFFIGGWYDHYDYEGGIDEVRISNRARDANWIRLQYENQKVCSSLVGIPVLPGNELSVTPGGLEIDEGQVETVSAVARGAEKLYWRIHREGKRETILTDRLSCPIAAGHVLNDEAFEIELQAIYPDVVRSIRIPVAVRNSKPEPGLKGIEAPSTWDGRTEVAIRPIISNIQELENAGHGDLNYQWSTSGVAIGSRIERDKLILTRAQGNGELHVQLTVQNGGASVRASTSIRIQQPQRNEESRVARPIAKQERPRDGQFIPRDGWGDDQVRTGTLLYSGNIDDETQLPWKPKRLRLRASDENHGTFEQIVEPNEDGTYAISVRIPAVLQTYRCELIAENRGEEKVLHQASDLMCGDVFLIIGQSNAVATDFGKDNDPAPSKWVRTFGSTSSDRNEARRERWGEACARADGGEFAVGYWGLELGKALVDSEKTPVCILNGAVGGTRIDQHQRNPVDPTDADTIYGRLLWRTRQARITHGVRGIFWHQGENDQGADGPTNRFGYETYESFFVQLAASWKEDYPNTEHYFAFQIWPKACAMGFDGSDNRLREVQRRLPGLFSNLSILSTLGIQPPGGCHYPAEGYAQFAQRMLPLVEQKIYGRNPSAKVTSPNLQEARWSDLDRKTIELVFDSNMSWNDRCVDQFLIGDKRLEVESGTANGDCITLHLKNAFDIQEENPARLTYLDSNSWSQDRLLLGTNGLEALSFCDVPIGNGSAQRRAAPSRD